MARKDNNELVNRNQAFLIYQDDNGIAQVNVRFEGEDVSNKTQNELKKNFFVSSSGREQEREPPHQSHNLDMIHSVLV